ncbi:hypothetical protein F4778DRAFT_205870 [Xylariomycetidae sp. FL2044]|nr:hypothetical protein F4778DRAFT_205870 [Xylariomycetidae sp. FL2044]
MSDIATLCPSQDGMQMGDDQTFQVMCDWQTTGNILATEPTDSVEACMEMCTSHQGTRCEAIAFWPDQGNLCELKSDLAGTIERTGVVSALAMLPEEVGEDAPTSDCAGLGDGTIQTARGKQYKLECGQVYTGEDMDVLFQETFAACRSTCAAHTLCVGVSYDASQDQGYNNCHLKLAGATLGPDQGFDSASLADEDAVAAAESTTAAVPSSTAIPTSAEESGGSGPNLVMILSIVGGVVGLLLIMSTVLGILLYRRRQRRQRAGQQNGDGDEKFQPYAGAGIRVSTMIDQRDMYKVPSVTSSASSGGREPVEEEQNGLAQNRVGSALMDYLRAIGRAK